MTMTDPIADMLTRIRNATIAMHDLTEMPSSKLKVALAKMLQQEGYIEGFEVADDPKRPGDKRTISGIKRVSKPGLRVYSAAQDVPRVLGGMGISVLSTNQGLLTDREARKRRVGGEVLCQVW